MKLAPILTVSIAAVSLASCASHRGPDSVSRAVDVNEERFESYEQRRAADFLVRMADARMMDIRESEIANNRATYGEVRDYAEEMITEQNVLLSEIRRLAEAQRIELPKEISNEKAEGLAKLAEKDGKELDALYIKMICPDHRRDVKAFREATGFGDDAVREFAQRRLPMIEEHLRMIEDLDEKY